VCTLALQFFKGSGRVSKDVTVQMGNPIMSTDKGRTEDSPAFAEQAARQTMDVVHATMATYFGWLQKLQSSSSWGNTPLNKALLKWTEQNIDTAFAFAHKLGQAKNAEEVAKLQTEFMQAQLNAFNEQMKGLGAAFIETTKGKEKTRFPKPTD